MKGKQLAAAICLAAVVVLAGCSGQEDGRTEKESSVSSGSGGGAAEGISGTSEEAGEDSGEEVPFVEGAYELADCIQLGDYRGLELTRASVEVTQEDVDSYIRSIATPEDVSDPQAEAQEGDTVNIAFEGRIDGETFQGGSSESYDLVLGSGRMIDGFEDGILGMKTGESRDLDLVFPENYQEASLQGQPVVFTITLNSIRRVPEITDAWVEESTGGEFSTAEDYRASIREGLIQNQEASAAYAMQQDAWNQIHEDSVFLQLPKELADKAMEQYDSDAESAAEAYGMELEDYLAAMNMTEDTYQEQREWYGRAAAESRLMLEALVQAEGLTEESPEYRAEVEELTEAYGVDEETLLSSYGEDSVWEYAMMQAVLDRILDQAVITEESSGTAE